VGVRPLGARVDRLHRGTEKTAKRVRFRCLTLRFRYRELIYFAKVRFPPCGLSLREGRARLPATLRPVPLPACLVRRRACVCARVSPRFGGAWCGAFGDLVRRRASIASLTLGACMYLVKFRPSPLFEHLSVSRRRKAMSGYPARFEHISLGLARWS